VPRRALGLLLAAALIILVPPSATATHGGPHMLDSRLGVRTVVSGLTTPTSLAFLGPSEFFVTEKNTGRVQRVVNGVVAATVLDLAVNSASERGLLGLALHPTFPVTPFVYLYWTETLSGVDSSAVADVPLLGNRVDRFVWNGTSLALDRNLIRLRALQADPGQAPAGNHNGGVIAFGPDGKLYILIGDVGRRGQLQNLRDGPFGPGIPDDEFGGPQPDDAHLTGTILRLNDDGSTPADNPFFAAGAAIGGEVGENIQKIFAYGLRNSFGMAFDPATGALWEQENGDDSFTELNRADPGFNSGWVQIMGPVGRVAQYKEIETTFGAGNLQQLRWPPQNIANTPEEALSRLFMLPGAHFSDPEFSWKFEVAPAGIGFGGSGLGPAFQNDLFMGAARPTLAGGHLFRFNLTPDRQRVAVDDSRIEDRVADNLGKFEITESETLLIGRDFGVGTDIETGPNGNLFVVSLSNGAVYEVFQRRSSIPPRRRSGGG
jgi:aldose sugar dehydrogenase